MSRPNVTAEIWITPSGYQITARDHSLETDPGNGTRVHTVCGSFRGTHDTVRVCEKLQARLIACLQSFDREELNGKARAILAKAKGGAR